MKKAPTSLRCARQCLEALVPASMLAIGGLMALHGTPDQKPAATGLHYEDLSDLELLRRMANQEWDKPIEVMRERVKSYDQTALEELAERIIDVGFNLRADSDHAVGLYAVSRQYLPYEWYAYVEAEGQRRRGMHVAPVIGFVWCFDYPFNNITDQNLEKLARYYIELETPAIYPQLWPHATHCGTERDTADALRRRMREIFLNYGERGQMYLAKLGIANPTRQVHPK